MKCLFFHEMNVHMGGIFFVIMKENFSHQNFLNLISNEMWENRSIIYFVIEDKLFDVSYVRDVLEMKQRSTLELEKKNTLNNKVNTNKELYREVYY